MISVVCIKWGRLYSSDYVNVLYEGVRANLTYPFRFICITDIPEGVRPEVETVALPWTGDESMARPGRWPKLAMFKAGVLPEAEIAMYFDLDMLITGSLDPVVEHVMAHDGLHILREWNPSVWRVVPLALRPDRGPQSSMIGWRPREQHHIFERYIADPRTAYGRTRNDQGYIGLEAANRHYFPARFGVSFRRHCVWHYPLNLIFREIPKPKAPVVVFHGMPKPTHLTRDDRSRWGTKYRFGFGPVPWVKDYWRRGLLAGEKALAASAGATGAGVAETERAAGGADEGAFRNATSSGN